MHIDIPEAECSCCGQSNSETFQRGRITGRRCLNCGHEVIYTDNEGNSITNVYWSNNTKVQF